MALVASWDIFVEEIVFKDDVDFKTCNIKIM